jgi:hypothetical protein
VLQWSIHLLLQLVQSPQLIIFLLPYQIEKFTLSLLNYNFKKFKNTVLFSSLAYSNKTIAKLFTNSFHMQVISLFSIAAFPLLKLCDGQ